MPITKPDLSKSIHREAFRHYLRTGERLTNAEWLARRERKFNPYHDEIGRFTSPPGVIVSYGKRGGQQSGRREEARRQPNIGRKKPVGIGKTLDADGPETPKPAHATNEAVSAAIQEAWAPVAPITSHFDLNKRQGYLDSLRRKAGPNASALEKAAFEETQRRLDAARSRLAEGDRIADREIVEIARTALPPLDTGLSAASLLSGEGGLGDALSVASSVPIVGAAGKFGKVVLRGRVAAKVSAGAAKEIVQLGGPHWKVRRYKPKGYEPHHIPANSINGLRYGEGPTIAMLKEHHLKTASHGRMPGSKAYLAKQRQLIREGKFREVVEMDIADIRAKFGSTYDDAIDQMIKYMDEKGFYMYIYPLRGAGSIEFGMNVSKVREIISGEFEEFRRIEFPEELRDKHPSDHFIEKGIFCYYDEHGFLEAIEFTEPARPMLGELDILNMSFRKADKALENIDPDVIRDLGSVISRRWSLAISKPGRLSDPAETFLAGRPGLYD